VNLIPVGLRDNIMLHKGGDLQAVDSETIGKLLYPHSNIPEKLVNRVYNRKKELFSDRDTILIKVGTNYTTSGTRKKEIESQFDSRCPEAFACNPDNPGQHPRHFLQKREIRFFTIPYGVVRICKFSRSPRAIDVIEKLLILQEAYLKGNLPTPDVNLESIAAMPRYSRQKNAALKAYAEREGIAPITARRRLIRYLEGERITGRTTKGRQFIQANHIHKYESVIFLYQSRVPAREVAKRTGVSVATVYRWARKIDNNFRPPLKSTQSPSDRIKHDLIVSKQSGACNVKDN
jgi:hypothetical protein